MFNRNAICTSADAYDSNEVDDLFYGSSVSVVELSKSTKFNFYPNPVADYIYATISNKLIHSRYHVYDSLGKSVLSGIIKTEKMHINVEPLLSGIYLVHIGNQTQKFIKN